MQNPTMRVLIWLNPDEPTRALYDVGTPPFWHPCCRRSRKVKEVGLPEEAPAILLLINECNGNPLHTPSSFFSSLPRFPPPCSHIISLKHIFMQMDLALFSPGTKQTQPENLTGPNMELASAASVERQKCVSEQRNMVIASWSHYWKVGLGKKDRKEGRGKDGMFSDEQQFWKNRLSSRFPKME